MKSILFKDIRKYKEADVKLAIARIIQNDNDKIEHEKIVINIIYFFPRSNELREI